jgi:hypothetical protein
MVFVPACEDLGEPSTDDVVDSSGTIIQRSSETFLIQSDAAFQQKGTTFYPLNLPDEFRRDGLRIRFSGKLEVDPTALYLYIPIRLSRIVQMDLSVKVYSAFPEFFLEKGTDIDSSYISLRGLRISGGMFELQATSWGIRETGLFLFRRNSPRSAIFVFMGDCGTVSTRTWEKVTLKHELAPVDQDTLWRIALTSHGDTLEVVRTSIALVEPKPIL